MKVFKNINGFILIIIVLFICLVISLLLTKYSKESYSNTNIHDESQHIMSFNYLRYNDNALITTPNTTRFRFGIPNARFKVGYYYLEGESVAPRDRVGQNRRGVNANGTANGIVLIRRPNEMVINIQDSIRQYLLETSIATCNNCDFKFSEGRRAAKNKGKECLLKLLYDNLPGVSECSLPDEVADPGPMARQFLNQIRGFTIRKGTSNDYGREISSDREEALSRGESIDTAPNIINPWKVHEFYRQIDEPIQLNLTTNTTDTSDWGRPQKFFMISKAPRETTYASTSSTVSDASASIVSDDDVSLVSDTSASIVSDASASIVSDASASIVSDSGDSANF